MQADDKYWFLRTKEEVFSELNTSEKGLNERLAQKRLDEQGPNVLEQEEKNKLLKIILRNFNNLLIYVLLGSSIISLLSDHYIEFYVILIIIVLTVFLGVLQEYRAGKSLDALKSLTAKKVEIIRNGKKEVMPAENLVRGDIIVLRRGMIIPADIRILESNALTVDESILTGETVQKPKISKKLMGQDILIGDKDNMAFSGTSVTAGTGLGVVVETGLNSEIGKISRSLKTIGDQKSPLQTKIDLMSRRISYIVLFVCVVLFIILMIRGISLFEALLLIGAVAVAGIPESFPLALTLSLSNGVKRMAKNKAIIRDLSSVETLGTTTVICSDKTGTLTQNKMLVKKIFFSDGFYVDIKGNGYSPDGKVFHGKKNVTKKKLSNYNNFFKACVLCNNSETYLENGSWILNGEPTEGAILTVAKSSGFDDVEIREDAKRIKEIPFDPAKKYMITVNSIGEKNIAYLKGSAEQVLNKVKYMRKGKKQILIKSKDRKLFEDKIHRLGGEGLRVLGIASKKVSNKSKIDTNDFVFEGLVAIQDPVRDDVADSVKECMSAGIRVMMITGDHKRTAESIGKSIGLLTNKYDKVIEGVELDKMDDAELDSIIERVAIFARTTPDHKLRIVSSLQRNGEIVAMTGDGVNDAPALKKANIGVSMGVGGTDVARESSNMVLADDSFSTIVNAVREGRTIYSNIRRFIYYLLAGNMTEVGLISLAIIAGLITPLTALMVLFINLITSTFPAIALSIEPTHHKVMRQKPRDTKERLLSRYILLKILVLVPILFLGTMILFQVEYQLTGSVEKARTIAFATLIMFELFHSFNARSLHLSVFNKGFFNNKFLFYAIFASIVLMVLAIHTGPGQAIFGTVALNAVEWLTIVIVSSMVLWISEVIKLLIKFEFEEQMNLKGLEHRLE